MQNAFSIDSVKISAERIESRSWKSLPHFLEHYEQPKLINLPSCSFTIRPRIHPRFHPAEFWTLLRLSSHFHYPLPYFATCSPVSKFGKSGDRKIGFSKFPSAENKVGRVSNGYPEYPIANLHVTEKCPPFSLEWIFPRDRILPDFFASFRAALLTGFSIALSNSPPRE